MSLTKLVVNVLSKITNNAREKLSLIHAKNILTRIYNRHIQKVSVPRLSRPEGFFLDCRVA